MITKSEDLLSWVLRVFRFYRTMLKVIIVNVRFSAKF